MIAKVPCTECQGTGVVAHQPRTLGNDDQGVPIIDPHDHQTVEICGKCGGGGMMAGTPPATG